MGSQYQVPGHLQVQWCRVLCVYRTSSWSVNSLRSDDEYASVHLIILGCTGSSLAWVMTHCLFSLKPLEWPIAVLWLKGALPINYSEIWLKLQWLSFKKMLLKMLSTKHYHSFQPQSEPMLTSSELDPKGHFSVKFYLKFKDLHSRNCIWKCWKMFGKSYPFCLGPNVLNFIFFDAPLLRLVP